MIPACRSRRPGLSLSELLFVIAVLAIVMGLLLPAVQRIRETSNRITCANHLKQIGLPYLHYHDTMGYLPDGGKNQGDPPPAPVLAPRRGGESTGAPRRTTRSCRPSSGRDATGL